MIENNHSRKFRQMKQKILVTGGTGYIGSHTVVELQESGFEVIIVDNLSNSDKGVLDNIQKISGKKPIFYEFDLTDSIKTDKLFEDHSDISAIIHFAASKAVGESVEKPLHYYQNNLVSLMNLLSSMIKHKVNNFVFSSSCTVYGQPDKLPVLENNTKERCRISLREILSVLMKILLKIRSKANPQLQTISLRYFNPIGAHESGLIGELPLGVPGNLVPFITQTAAGLRNKLRIFGDNYNTPDGTAMRDYINGC